jgi:hypothetical protein
VRGGNNGVGGKGFLLFFFHVDLLISTNGGANFQHRVCITQILLVKL